MNPHNDKQPRRWVSDRYLAKVHYDCHRSSIWRWVKLGRLPKPVKISPGCSRFDYDEILRRDAERVEESA